MNKRFVKPAKLPRGAYGKSLSEAVTPYIERKPFNSWPNDVVQEWYTSQAFDPIRKCYEITVVCPRCSTVALKYRDKGIRLTPQEIEHCGVKGKFYISEVI